MNGKIAVLCPSLGRPDLLTRFWSSAKHPLCDLGVYVSKHDPRFRDGYLGLGLPLYIGEVKGYAARLNELARLMPGYSAYFTAEDDYVCIEPRWAEIYLDALPPSGVALIADECGNWPHTAMMGAGWVERLGGIHPPQDQHHCLAQVWRDIALAADCGIKVARCWEHHEATPRRHGVEFTDADNAAYLAWASAGGAAAAAAKLKGILV